MPSHTSKASSPTRIDFKPFILSSSGGILTAIKSGLNTYCRFGVIPNKTSFVSFIFPKTGKTKITTNDYFLPRYFCYIGKLLPGCEIKEIEQKKAVVKSNDTDREFEMIVKEKNQFSLLTFFVAMKQVAAKDLIRLVEQAIISIPKNLLVLQQKLNIDLGEIIKLGPYNVKSITDMNKQAVAILCELDYKTIIQIDRRVFAWLKDKGAAFNRRSEQLLALSECKWLLKLIGRWGIDNWCKLPFSARSLFQEYGEALGVDFLSTLKFDRFFQFVKNTHPTIKIRDPMARLKLIPQIEEYVLGRSVRYPQHSDIIAEIIFSDDKEYIKKYGMGHCDPDKFRKYTLSTPPYSNPVNIKIEETIEFPLKVENKFVEKLKLISIEIIPQTIPNRLSHLDLANHPEHCLKEALRRQWPVHDFESFMRGRGKGLSKAFFYSRYSVFGSQESAESKKKKRAEAKQYLQENKPVPDGSLTLTIPIAEYSAYLEHKKKQTDKKSTPSILYNSSNRGCGVKTLRPIKKGCIIGGYVGYTAGEEECRQVRGFSVINTKVSYLCFLNDKVVIDASICGNLTAFINSAPTAMASGIAYFSVKVLGLGGEVIADYDADSAYSGVRTANVKFIRRHNEKYVMAKCNIAAGQELCLDYGNDYYKNTLRRELVYLVKSRRLVYKDELSQHYPGLSNKYPFWTKKTGFLICTGNSLTEEKETKKAKWNFKGR